MMDRSFHILPQASPNHLPIAAKTPRLEAALPCMPIADILRPTHGTHLLDAWYIPQRMTGVQSLGGTPLLDWTGWMIVAKPELQPKRWFIAEPCADCPSWADNGVRNQGVQPKLQVIDGGRKDEPTGQ
jgi:hypothetical protein